MQQHVAPHAHDDRYGRAYVAAGQQGKKKAINARVYVLLVIGTAALVAALVLFLGNKPAPVNPATDFQPATVVYVIDGDTIDVEIEGERERVRLIGIDAPESANHDEALNTAEGEHATEHARSLLAEGATVYLQTDRSEYDRYGRLLRYVWMELPTDADDAQQIAAYMFDARMVADGYAKAVRFEPDTRYATVFEKLQAEAVARGAGVSYLWA